MENISKRAQEILKKRGITRFEEVFSHTPRSLMNLGVPLDDLFALQAQLKKQKGLTGRRHLLSRSWSKNELRRLRKEKEDKTRGTSLIPPGVEVDESVLKRTIHRSTTGKHYKKPRRKGLF